MGTNYPTGYDLAVTVPATLDGTPLHSEMHDDDRDAIVAIETALGVSPADGFTDVKARVKAVEDSVIQVGYNPPTDQDSSTVGGAWVNTGSVTIPTWATRARVITTVNGVYPISTVTTQFGWWPRIGTANGTQVLLSGDTINRRQDAASVSMITLDGTGAQTLYVYSTRVSASGQFRADSSSDFTFAIDWLR